MYFVVQRNKPTIGNSEQALKIAYTAIGEFNNYEKSVPPTVELKDGIYYVTFALPKNRPIASRESDYAMQIQIEAKSGKVTKKLASY